MNTINNMLEFQMLMLENVNDDAGMFRNNTFYLSVSNKISGKTPLNKAHGGIGLQKK